MNMQLDNTVKEEANKHPKLT